MPLFSSRKGGRLVRVAVVGAGIDLSHPEIQHASNEKKIVASKGFQSLWTPLGMNMVMEHIV